MRLDVEEGLFGERKKGARAVVKGDPKASSLYQRIVTEDEDDLMPPPDSHKKLTPEQKALIARWIEQGAPWEAHWAFITPTRPAAPAVKQAGWVRNPIDAFVLAKLEEKGLRPAPPSCARRTTPPPRRDASPPCAPPGPARDTPNSSPTKLAGYPG
jgi:hypothetical protein